MEILLLMSGASEMMEEAECASAVEYWKWGWVEYSSSKNCPNIWTLCMNVLIS